MLCKADFAMVPSILTLQPTEAQTGWSVFVNEEGQLLYANPSSHRWTSGSGTWSGALPAWADGDSVTIEAPAEGSSPREIELDKNVVATEATLNGANTLTGLYGLNAERLTLADGATLAFKPTPIAPISFRHLRFTMIKNSSRGGGELTPAELILTKGNEVVAWPLGTTISGNGKSATWEGNRDVCCLIDGVYGTTTTSRKGVNPATGEPTSYSAQENWNKWMAYESKGGVAVITLGEEVSADGYRLWSSEYGDGMPSVWTVEVSQDGNDWVLFDKRTIADIPANNAPSDYKAPSVFSVTARGVLTLGKSVTLDFSAGLVPLTAETVKGPGATIVLPKEGVTAFTPFLVAPYSESLTFTFAKANANADETLWVVYANGAYGVAPKPIQPVKATITADVAWEDAPWTNANGAKLSAYIWAQRGFEPDVELTFGDTKTLKFDERTIGILTIQPPPPGKEKVQGSVKTAANGELHVKELVAKGNALVDKVKVADGITIADGVTFVADIGSVSRDYIYTCPITGTGTATFQKRGSNKLTFTKPVEVPLILHTWNASSTLRFEADGVAKMDFNGNTGKVEIAKGVTFTLLGSNGRTTQADLFSGEGTLKIAKGAELTFAKADFFDARKLATLELTDGIVLTVGDPAEGRVHIKYNNPTDADAAKLTVKGQPEWVVEPKVGEGYALSFLPMPSEGTNLEGEALATVRAAAKQAGLGSNFAVTCSNNANPADAFTCFSGLPVGVKEGNDFVTITCNFGIAALRVPNTEYIYLLAKVDQADFADGVQFAVKADGEAIEADPVTDPTEVGLPATGAGEQWLRLPFPQTTKKYTLSVTK